MSLRNLADDSLPVTTAEPTHGLKLDENYDGLADALGDCDALGETVADALALGD